MLPGAGAGPVWRESPGSGEPAGWGGVQKGKRSWIHEATSNSWLITWLVYPVPSMASSRGTHKSYTGFYVASSPMQPSPKT